MALQGSGAISLSQIQTEFGGSAPIGLTEYYGKSTVPSSGPLQMTDFYGTSSAYAITGAMVPNDYTFVAGPTKDAATMISRMSDGNINTYVGGRSSSAQGWPTEFRMRNTAIRDAVQAKIGTAIPTTTAGFNYINTNNLAVRGWVKASNDGTYWTMDGDIQFQMLDDNNDVVSLTAGIIDSHIDSGQGTIGWEWRTVSNSVTNVNDEFIAKWLHGGCNSRFKRTTATYDTLGDISDAVFNLDFSVS